MAAYAVIWQVVDHEIMPFEERFSVRMELAVAANTLLQSAKLVRAVVVIGGLAEASLNRPR